MATRKTYHIAPNDEGGSNVKAENALRAFSLHDTKADVMERAEELAKAQPLGQVVVHGQGGRIQTEHTYGQDLYPPRG